MIELSPYASDEEVARVLRECGVRLHSRVGGDPYPVDWHYESYVLASINTVEDALAMCDKLDEECNAHSSHKTGCAKARSIRRWLKDWFWLESSERIRAAMATNRRVCCCAHESYSFALRKQYRGKTT